MNVRVTRRRTLKTAVGAAVGGGLAALGLGEARATTEWDLASPMYAKIGQSWHSNALDMTGQAGSVSVYAYFRRGSQAYGYIEPTQILTSCETSLNPTHRILDFNLRTDGAQSYVGAARAQHVESIGVATDGTLYRCPQWLAAQGSGTTEVSGCYEGSPPNHLHYWANGQQAGTFAYGTSVYLDSPVMWTWQV